MRQYIVRRFLLSLMALFFVSIATAGLIRIVPGDTVLAQIGEAGDITPSPEVIEALRQELGLDEPFHIQYLEWMGGIFRGDFGDSYSIQGQPITSLIGKSYPVTVQIAIMAIIIALAVAIPIGVISATRQDSPADYVGRLFAVTGLSVPDFVWATLVILYAAIWFDYTPPFLWTPFFEDPIENLKMTIIPSLILGLRFSSSTMRMTRSAVLEVLREDYVRTAWAKGLNERVIIIRHVLKNALIPVVTIVGTLFAFLLGGTLIVETIFNLPGLGQLAFQGITQRDYPIVQTTVLLAATVIVLMNFIVDLSYAWLDPRIRYS